MKRKARDGVAATTLRQLGGVASTKASFIRSDARAVVAPAASRGQLISSLHLEHWNIRRRVRFHARRQFWRCAAEVPSSARGALARHALRFDGMVVTYFYTHNIILPNVLLHSKISTMAQTYVGSVVSHHESGEAVQGSNRVPERPHVLNLIRARSGVTFGFVFS